MTATIGLLRAQNNYAVCEVVVDALAEMLRSRGLATVDFDGIRLEQDLAVLREAGVTAVLAWNGILADASAANGCSVWDEARIPLIAWLLDHPLYNLRRVGCGARLLVAGCMDETHAAFLKQWDVTESVTPIHHFAVGDPPNGGRVTVARDIDVLFPATVIDPAEVRREWDVLPPAARALVEESTAECLAENHGNLAEIMRTLAPQVGLNDPRAIGEVIGYAFIRADQYVRAQRRLEILTVLADAGIVVDQVGYSDPSHPVLRRHRAHGPLPAATVLRWMRRARTVVHAGVNFAAGSHERVFTAQRQGAVVISEVNAFWQQLLTDRRDALLFCWDALEALPSRIHHLLRNHAELDQIRAHAAPIAEESIQRAGDEILGAIQVAQELAA